MTGQDLLLIIVVGVTVGTLWGRIGLRQSPFAASRWVDVTFFLVLAGATAVIYALLDARQIHEDSNLAVVRASPSAPASSDLETLVAMIIGGVAFLGAPLFAYFRAARATGRAELRGYAFALLAILGVGLCSMIFNLVHRLDDPATDRPGLTTFLVQGGLALPAFTALILVVSRWHRLPPGPARRNISA